MKVILHIGSPKTGTTYLQKSLLRSRKYLLSKGVFYPEPLNKRYNHKILSVDCLPYKNLPRHIHKGLSEAELVNERVQFLAKLRKEVDEYSPKCMIISSESIWRYSAEISYIKLKEDFEKLGATRVAVVAYLRKPSDYYLALFQQNFLASHSLKNIILSNYKKNIGQYIDIFGRSAMCINLFDRSSLIDHDILTDFCKKYLQDFGVREARLKRSNTENASLSAEAMAIQRDYRLNFYSNKENVKNADSEELFNLLKYLQNEANCERPRLKEKLREYVDCFSGDSLWLRDEFGIEFPNYDYAKVGQPMERDSSIVEGFDKLEDIVELNRDRQRTLIKLLRASSWAQERPERLDWLRNLDMEIGD